MLRRMMRWMGPMLIAAAIVGGPYAYSEQRDKHVGNFRVVEPGVLYRCAQPSPVGLDRLVHDYGIKTVVSFRDDSEGRKGSVPDAWESAACSRLGINYVKLPAKVWSYEHGVVPADENVRRFLEVMRDAKNHPVLIHCFRGIHRTGIFGAIYRMDCQGWTNDEAIEELRRLGYTTLDGDHDVRQYLESYKPKGPAKRGQP